MSKIRNSSLISRVVDRVGSSGARSPKVFCISFQRTGTTSVGRFFHDHGFPVATWSISRDNDWPLRWFKGDHEHIFSSQAFKDHSVYEDFPWGGTDFYKILFHRFPEAKFIHLERDADKWFDSMMAHSAGRTLGNTHRHSCMYHREEEYHALGDLSNAYTSVKDNALPLLEENRAHYKRIYTNANREVRLFFNKLDENRLYSGSLEDTDIWAGMAAFFSVKMVKDYSVHVNASKDMGR